MAPNFLQLNNTKTEIILFSPPNHISHYQKALGPLSVNIKPTARNLGVHFDSELAFIPHVNKLVQSCFCQLRPISRIKYKLTPPNLEKVIHTFIFSRLDDCNSLLSGISQKSLSHQFCTQLFPTFFLEESRWHCAVWIMSADIIWVK